MASTFEKEMIVEFSETDMAGIVHFTQFFRYAERTEHAFLRSLGMSVVDGHSGDADGNRHGWPRVHASFDYVAPLRFEQTFRVVLGVERLGERSVHYLFRVESDRAVHGIGKISAAYVRFDAVTKKVKGVAVPANFREAISCLTEQDRDNFLSTK